MFGEGSPFEIVIESANLYEKPFIGGLLSYVIVRHGLQRFKTVTRRGQAPVWNQRFQFSKTFQDELIRIVVIEEGTFWDSKIGEAAIEISKLQLSGRVILPLSNEGVAAGQITVSIGGGYNIPYMPQIPQMPLYRPQVPRVAPTSPIGASIYAPPMVQQPLVKSIAPPVYPQTFAPQAYPQAIAPQVYPQNIAPTKPFLQGSVIKAPQTQFAPMPVSMKASLPTTLGPKYI